MVIGPAGGHLATAAGIAVDNGAAVNHAVEVAVASDLEARVATFSRQAARHVELIKFENCPAYLREWIARTQKDPPQGL